MNSFISGIISGLIASAVLYILLYRIKPKVRVAEKACQLPEDKNHISIKVVNMTNSNLIDVSCSLHFCQRGADGNISANDVLKHPIVGVFINSHLDEDKMYAIRLPYKVSDFQRAQIDDGHAFLMFTFYARHSVSGTPVFIQKKYSSKSIIAGFYENGDSTEIVSPPNIVSGVDNEGKSA